MALASIFRTLPSSSSTSQPTKQKRGSNCKTSTSPTISPNSTSPPALRPLSIGSTQLPGKKTIVLLSTGVDTSPPEDPQAIQRKLLTSDIRILAVSLSADFRKPAKKHKKRDASRLLPIAPPSTKRAFAKPTNRCEQLAAATGGRVYFPTNADEFSRAYAEIAQLVRHEYSLAFALPAADGQLHSLKVKAKKSSYQVDHRQAYLAPPQSNREAIP